MIGFIPGVDWKIYNCALPLQHHVKRTRSSGYILKDLIRKAIRPSGDRDCKPPARFPHHAWYVQLLANESMLQST